MRSVLVRHKATNRMPGDGILLFDDCLIRNGLVYSYSGMKCRILYRDGY